MSDDKLTPAQRAKLRDEEMFSLDAKEILNIPENRVFKERLGRFIIEYKKRDFLEQEEIDKAIEDTEIDITLSIDNEEDIEIFNEQIDKVQKARDKFIKILNRANADYKFVSRWFEHFYEVWKGKFNRLSSDKKREGEAEFILSLMIDDLIRCDRMNDQAKSIYKNLNDKYESISRKITVIQELYKILDIQRPMDSKGSYGSGKKFSHKKTNGNSVKNPKPSEVSDPQEADWSKDF